MRVYKHDKQLHNFSLNISTTHPNLMQSHMKKYPNI